MGTYTDDPIWLGALPLAGQRLAHPFLLYCLEMKIIYSSNETPSISVRPALRRRISQE